jgi:hypothetical protein
MIADMVSGGFSNEFLSILKKLEKVEQMIGPQNKKLVAGMVITAIIGKVYDNTDEILEALEGYKKTFIAIESRFNKER